MKLLWRSTLLIASILIWGIVTSPVAWAAGVVGTGSPASCDTNDLQTAINGGGTVTFNCGDDPYTITANTYVIGEDTTILGENKITLDGENLRQLFIVDNGATLTLKGIALLDGEAASGGCIAVDIMGTLITSQVTFRGCHDTSMTVGGGAVYNLGDFTATETIFESNEADKEGGAIFNRGIFQASFVLFENNRAGDDSGALENDGDGVAVINDSAFIGNQAQGGGGAVGNTLSFPNTVGSFSILRSLFADNSSGTVGGAINNVIGIMSVANSTFVRNTSNQGGAIFSSGNTDTTIRFSTFDNNRADTGGAIYRPLTGVVTLGYSVLARSRNEANTSDQLECDGPAFASLGYNLIEDNSCVDGTKPTDIRNTDPQLGTLADNGGFSQTILPEATSPAIGAVPIAECVPRDQRFAKRIGTCDIGAAESDGLFESAYMPRVNK